MNYYKKHLGDFARKTAHLSILENGVYNILLDAYYDRERSLSEVEAIRFSRAHSPEELQAVKVVLSEFFVEENGMFSQEHADEVIAEFHKRQKINRKLGAIGGKRNAKRLESESLPKEEAKSKPSHKPLATSHKEQEQEISNPKGLEPLAAGEKAKPVPFEEIIELYHAKLPQCRRLEKLTDARKGHIRQRWREDLPTLDAWGNYFDDVAGSPFLTGRVQGRDGKPPFVADLEWLCKPGSFAKVAEGKYHR